MRDAVVLYRLVALFVEGTRGNCVCAGRRLAPQD